MSRFSTPHVPKEIRLKPQKGIVFLSGLLIAGLLFCLSAFGQNATGSLSGTVTDATGAVIPGAKVVLKNEATQTTRETISNGSGFFSFAAVQPASYSVLVSAGGFSSWEETGLSFSQGASLSIAPTLKVSTSKTEVQVISAAESPVPTDNGATSTTLNSTMINEIAIQGRDAAELIKIMPGMGMNTGLTNSMWNSLTTSSNNGPIGNFSANGTAPNGGMTMTSDGANLLDPGNQGTQTSNINQNQIAEMTVLTSAYGADFAKGPVTFQAIGKSGGSQFHGQAYLYARDGTFNSNFSQDNALGVKAAQDSYYYPGGDIGGPVIIPKVAFNKDHDKLFFYAAYENMRQNPAQSAITRFIPTQDMMNGNFTQSYLNSLGSNFLNGPYAADGIAVGQLPASQLDPNSAAYYKTFSPQAAPNTNPATNPNGANFTYLPVLPVNRWELRLRGDYNISSKSKVFFSWNRQDETDLNPISIWWGTGNDIPFPSQMPAKQVSQVYSSNFTHTFSPTLTNEFVFADATFINPISLSNPSAGDPTKAGFNMVGLFSNPYKAQLPNLINWEGTVPGYFAPTFGQQWQGGDFGKLSQTPSFSDNLTKVWGTHTIKVGAYWDYARNQQTGSDFSNPPQGAVNFEGYTGVAGSYSNPLANFASGYATGLAQENGTPVADFKYHEIGFFFNDQWKATRRLTLTLGIRFDHYGNWYPSSGPGLAVWDPATYNNTSAAGAWTGLQWHAINSSIPISGMPSRSLWPLPRVGVAYDLFGNGKTVLRGGFGMYRFQLSYNNASGAAFSAPLGYETESTTWGCCKGWESFNQFSPSLGAAGLGSAPSGVMTMGDDKTPWTSSYNFTISQRLPWNSVMEVQYSGNQSHDLLLDSAISNVNNIPKGAFFGPDPITGVINDPTSGSFPTNDYYPFHNYTGMTLISHGSYQYYNAAIVTWQKQTGRQTFTTNYTFSKVLGIRDGQTSNGGGNGSLIDPFSLRANYGVLAYDHTHIFNAAYVLNLPDPIHGNKLLGGVVNGWELSGITQFQTGAPIQPSTAGTLNAQFGNVPEAGNASGIAYNPSIQLGTNAYATLLPTLTCDPRNGLKSGQYFNPNCFAPPAPGTLGTGVWPYIHGPDFFNSDLSLFKNFKIGERQKIQLRFEAFNFLNHPLPQLGAVSNGDITLKFSNASGFLTQTNQNQATTGYAQNTVGRRVVEFAIKYQF
jgi:hypothetical protein